MRISVLESGSWGTALAVSLASNPFHSVTLHSIYQKSSNLMRASNRNPLLPDTPLPPSLSLRDDFLGLPDADIAVFASPSFAIRAAASQVKHLISPSTILVSVAKGIEANSSLRLSQILLQELGDYDRIAALSGPSHAEEVAQAIPTGCVAASVNINTAKTVQDAFMSPSFRVYTSTDIIGVELAGALKNVIAISVGISDGLNFGDNTKAMLITRGLSEMARLGTALGAKLETFSGLAGLGDLIVTCSSNFSRNRQAGLLIGAGASASDAIASVGTVEGYYATAAAIELARSRNVIMPIASELFNVLYLNKDPRHATVTLMNRTKKDELFSHFS